MKKWMSTIILLLVSALAGCCVKSNLRHPEGVGNAIDQARAQTVALVTRDKDDDIAAYCAGVWVGIDTILTANHCVEGAAEMADIPEELMIDLVGLPIKYVIESDIVGQYKEPKAIYSAVTAAQDKKNDLALVRVIGDIPNHPIAVLAEKVPSMGSQLFLIGHVSGVYWTFTPAYVVASRPSGWLYGVSTVKGKIIQVSGAMWFGNSGGGAFTEFGELVGISSFIMRTPNMGFLIHLDTIKEFLYKNKVRT